MSALGDRQRRFVRDLGLLIAYAYERGFELTSGEGYRSEEQQQIYVRTGASKVDHSLHQDKLAHDFNVFRDGVWLRTSEPIRPLGEYWESINPDNIWGGSFPRLYNTKFSDGNHFEQNPRGRKEPKEIA